MCMCKPGGRDRNVVTDGGGLWMQLGAANTCRHLTANGSLMRAHFEEETARAALLLEAAAYELMRCNPPCARKAAFHLVLAGLRYHAAKQKRLAVHCYMQVSLRGRCFRAKGGVSDEMKQDRPHQKARNPFLRNPSKLVTRPETAT